MELAHRRELAAFLRSRRARLSPGDVGLSSGNRRRTPGLRRDEVAQMSGISVTWYTWIEQARDISVSRQVLDSLARTLRLTPHERRHLFGLAGESLPAAELRRGPTSPVLQQLVDALDPNPAYLLDAAWHLLAWNRAEAGLIGDPAERDESERNLIWLVFVDPVIRDLMVDWPGQARALLAQYRGDAGQHAGDPRFEALTSALRRTSPRFREWWDRHDVAGFGSTRWELDHPRAGRLTVNYVKLSPLESPEVKLFVCLPANDATARRLPGLVTPRNTDQLIGAPS